jgi:energy-coupling factor transporter ATP-binding protein EcfA2
LLDEPTRGVDVGARADIYAMIRRLSAAGTSVVMASSDLPELIGLSDRVLILSGGRQAGIVEAAGLTPAALVDGLWRPTGRGGGMNIALHCGATARSTGFALMVIFFAVNLPETFLTPRNLLNVSQQISMLAVVAFTMTVVMSMGDFDLSVGTMASLAGVVAATLFVAGWPVPWAIAAALAVGRYLGGLLNGFLVSILGILPFVATLGR